MWICLAFFGHGFQAQAFQPLPSFQLLVPFHLLGYGAVGEKIKKRGRQQDCIISQNSTWSYKQSKAGFMNLIYLWVFHGSHRHAIIYLLVEPLFVRAVGNSLCNDWDKKSSSNNQTIPHFQLHLGLLIHGVAAASSVWRGHLNSICNRIRGNGCL